MMYSPVTLIHICGGIAGVASGFVALLSRKGSRVHRTAGNVFVISMLLMAAGGALVAIVKSQAINALMGVFTMYLVATAWLVVQRNNANSRRLTLGLLMLVLIDSAVGFGIGWQALHSATGRFDGDAAAAFFLIGSLALLFAVFDIRILIRRSLTRAQQLARHLGRMCFALFIAAGSFFLGTASDPVFRREGLRAQLFTKAVRHTHLPEVPVLIVVVLMVYWLVRVRFSNAYKKARP